MCHRTTCRTCGKPTWAGCGNHVEQALAGVPRNQRCNCRETGAAPAPSQSIFSRIFG